jgi:hypothetical protein
MNNKTRAILIVVSTILMGYFFFHKNYPRFTKVNVPFNNYNFGTVSKSHDLTTDFNIINVGNNKLEIEKIVPDCDCTVSAWEKVKIDEQDTFNFKIEVNKAKFGFFQQNILVYGNFDTSPELFYVQGRIAE